METEGKDKDRAGEDGWRGKPYGCVADAQGRLALPLLAQGAVPGPWVQRAEVWEPAPTQGLEGLLPPTTDAALRGCQAQGL